MTRSFSGFPGNAPQTGKAVFTDDFPPDKAPVEIPTPPETPPVDLGSVPPVNPETGLPMIRVDEALSESSFGQGDVEDFPGEVPDEVLDFLF